MNKREYMNVLERCAAEYCPAALVSIKRNQRANNLSEIDFKIINITPWASQRFTEAVIIDFINYVGCFHGLNEGFSVKYLAEEMEKNKKLGKRKKKK